MLGILLITHEIVPNLYNAICVCVHVHVRAQTHTPLVEVKVYDQDHQSLNFIILAIIASVAG